MTVPSREIAQRELRNRITEVLREVEHGVALRVTVRGRPVADLVPVESERHRRFVPRSTVERLLAECPPDAGFVADVDEALGQTIDELR